MTYLRRCPAAAGAAALFAIGLVKAGYIKDDDAKDWKADELLKNISSELKEI